MDKNSNHPDSLMKALIELDHWLEEESIVLELEIIGSFALYLQGITHIRTKDIDTVRDLDEEIIKKVNTIAPKHGLVPLWLNDDSAGLPRPKGFETRLTKKRIGNHLLLLVASRLDLIQLKAAAYIDRGNEDPKDLADLKNLKPTQAEIDEAISFIRETRRPEKPVFYPNYEEMLEDIRNVGKE
jgi:hypothetical protein